MRAGSSTAFCEATSDGEVMPERNPISRGHHPQVLATVASGVLHASAVSLLRTHLTPRTLRSGSASALDVERGGTKWERRAGRVAAGGGSGAVAEGMYG